MPADGAERASFDKPAESVLSRADEGASVAEARGSAQWQRFSQPEPYAEVIEVEFETVPPAPEPDLEAVIQRTVRANGGAAADAFDRRAFEAAQSEVDDVQPPPPDIEAIAAALAVEMDRNAARNATPAPEQPPVVLEVEASPHVEPATPAPEQPPVVVEVEASPKVEAAPLDISEAAASILAAALETPPVGDETPPVDDIALPREDCARGKNDSAESPPTKVDTLFGRLATQILPRARQAADFARAKAAPAMIAAGFWLAHNLRRKEIRRRYGAALAMAHGRILDRQLEQHFFIPSRKAERFSPDPERGILYEGPVPVTAFNWMMSALPPDLREYAFIDFRAGLGRAMLLASQRRFEHIIGYEYGAAAYDDLQMNIAQFPRSKMLCRDVQCHRGDRIGVSIPDQPCVLYVANAWREEFLSGIMTYLGESHRHKPRMLYLILENVDEKVVLPKNEIFFRVDLPLAEKLKLRLFSPMDFQVYRTLA